MLNRSDVESRRDAVDKRSHTRYATRLEGRLLTFDNRHNVKCLVTDVSEGGARIATANLQSPCGKATLFIHETGDILECDIRWQRANEIGLRVLDGDSLSLNFCELEPIR